MEIKSYQIGLNEKRNANQIKRNPNSNPKPRREVINPVFLYKPTLKTLLQAYFNH